MSLKLNYVLEFEDKYNQKWLFKENEIVQMFLKDNKMLKGKILSFDETNIAIDCSTLYNANILHIKYESIELICKI